MSKTVVGLYDDSSVAQNVVSDLQTAGFSRSDIQVSGNDLGGLQGQIAQPKGDLQNNLIDAGVTQNDAGNYAEAVRRGAALVMVECSDDMAQQAADIMDRYNPINVGERVAGWRASGWREYQPSAKPFTSDEAQQERTQYADKLNQEGNVTLPVTEEELRVGKRQTQTGGVRVHTRVTDKPVEQTVNLRQENVSVERRQVDRPASEADLNAFEEGTIEVPEMSEEAITDKQARVVEEVDITKDVQDQQQTIRDTVRRTDVETEPLTGRQGTTGQGDTFDTFEPDFRQHYNTTYGNMGYDYNRFRPAYRYGYDMARDTRFRNAQNWSDVEPQLRNDWQQSYPNNDWSQYRDAIRSGWETAHNA